jgi:hypothetical protein
MEESFGILQGEKFVSQNLKMRFSKIAGERFDTKNPDLVVGMQRYKKEAIYNLKYYPKKISTIS